MTKVDWVEMIVLAALWGGSFLLMKISVPEFGSIPLIAIRTFIAACILFPVLLVVYGFKVLDKKNIFHLMVVGVLSSAVPFSLLSYTTLNLSAGLSSILNSTAPIFTALVAWFWLRKNISWSVILGIIFGSLGVYILFYDPQIMSEEVNYLPVVAALLATFCYGVGTNYTKQKLSTVKPIQIAFYSQLFAAFSLLPFAWLLWPQTAPTMSSWWATIILGVACTAIAYILFFRLISRLSADKAISVTYLIPLFGVFWGMLFLDESLTWMMILGGALILLGITFSSETFFKKR